VGLTHDSMGPPPRAITDGPPVCPAQSPSANAALARTPALRRKDLRFSEITVQLQNWSEPSIEHSSRSAGFWRNEARCALLAVIDGADRDGCDPIITKRLVISQAGFSSSRGQRFFLAFSRFSLDAFALAAERFLPPLRPSLAASGSFRFAMGESYHSKRDSPRRLPAADDWQRSSSSRLRPHKPEPIHNHLDRPSACRRRAAIKPEASYSWLRSRRDHCKRHGSHRKVWEYDGELCRHVVRELRGELFG
jgi:hypothetical protein